MSDAERICVCGWDRAKVPILERKISELEFRNRQLQGALRESREEFLKLQNLRLHEDCHKEIGSLLQRVADSIRDRKYSDALKACVELSFRLLELV
jgi:hypothetical protein